LQKWFISVWVEESDAKKRAKEVNKKLRKDGWKIIRFGEHDILKSPAKCVNKIKKTYEERHNS